MRSMVAWKEAGSSSQAYGQVPAVQANREHKGSQGRACGRLSISRAVVRGRQHPLVGLPAQVAHWWTDTILLHTIPT